MKNKKQAVWIGVDQLNNTPAYQEAAKNEFNELPVVGQMADKKAMSVEASRRDFLKYLGFGLGAATIAAGCEIPVKKAIPYVVKPDAIVPGVATYYASTFVQGGDYCPVLVKTREGRPIKVEGNSLSPITMGGTSARAQASVLSLYDTSRIDGPYWVKDGAIDRLDKKTWADLDKEVMGKLNANSQIRIVTNTILSPTTKKAIADFTAKYPNTKVITYDPVSSSAILQANEATFGQRVIPDYHFDKAEVIVSFDADFLGTWISPIEYAAKYVKNRKIDDVKKAKLSRHIQVENHMSLTGSNADNRILVKPTEQGAAILALYKALGGSANGPSLDAEKTAKIKKIADELKAARGKALVVSGSNNMAEQVIVNAINNLLNSYGNTITFAHASMQRQGVDADMQALIREMNGGSVDALFVMDGANPAYDLPNSDQFVTGAGKVGLKVSFSGVPNETLALCNYAAPTHHYLESWGDAEAKKGHYTLIQPTIAPIFGAVGRAGTREAEMSLLTWSENLPEGTDSYMDYLKKHWEENIFPQQTEYSTFQVFWDNALHNGVFDLPQTSVEPVFNGETVAAVASKVRKPASADTMEISFFETVNMGAGQYANNPWLMEMPDPITRCVWGNYLAIPVMWDGGNEFSAYKNLNASEFYAEADKVEVEINGKKEVATVIRQFGQMRNTFGLAVGYGRSTTGYMGQALGENIGVNVYPWMSIDEDGNTQYYATNVNVSDRVGKDKEFACVQYHHTMGVTARDENGEVVKTEEGEALNVDEKTVMTLGAGYQGGLVNRSIIYQDSLDELDHLVEHIDEKRSEAQKLNSKGLYPFDEYTENFYSQGHHWAMHVDLNACIGCGACQVACVAENNVTVVGKTEVHRHHEMTWLRIDRYYYGDYENPNVVYQPMMCQHCDNAPCENVCPVAATNHSSEGLNQMTYNRCIGTRYCANNCPYKVRRFNWLDYTTADLFAYNEATLDGEEIPFGADNLTRMVLNPDVTVRSRGVIEKCSFCVQRIQEGKLTAKREGRALMGNDVKTACQTACPTGAIVFGDRNDKESMIADRIDNPLNYLVLEEINVQSSVYYAAKVNNRKEELDA
ncbi:MAG: TAT-variant-translocated molybdopterin oxidoreductase [Saprospiraceae bacterium]|nr:TAT-variant-translocated molybdopterin oxidoreductase [Saprospiraceae bacterium]